MKGRKKNMKKFLNFMLILAVALFAIVPRVSAVTTSGNGATDDGSITIRNPKVGEEYSIYKILTLESYVDVDGDGSVTSEGESDEDDGYVYKKTTDDWADFIETSGFFTIDPNGTVELVAGTDAAELAKDALAYAKLHGIDPIEVIEAEEGKDVEFTGLEYGYYLVDTTLGTLCGLGTTSKDIIINEKNTDPTVDKYIVTYEDGTVATRNKANNKFVGEIVYYETQIDVGSGAYNYVLYDTMSEGLTFNDDIVVKIGTTTLDIGEDYTVNKTNADYTFIITFTTELESDDVIVVTYSATLNEDAITAGNNNEAGNTNETVLKYGNTQSVDSETTTYTYKFDLIKTNDGTTILKDAEFELYDDITGGNRIFVVEESEGYYYVTQTPNNVKIKAGVAEIKGLARGTYYLEETRNPDGYNKLLARQRVAIENSDIITTLTKGTTNGADVYTTGGVQVINTKGTLLPETGGIGTTLFIVIGSGMVLSFGLLLVTKLRMSKEEN